ncbi:MAG: class I SAM-dependent methyltransferase [Geminicoccaceae bacterium]
MPQANAEYPASAQHVAGPVPAAPACDCCGSRAWKLAFAADGMHLGRCAECGLHYVAEMPTQAQRVDEMAERKFGKQGHVLEASRHLAGETIRRKEFQHYVDLAHAHAPAGPWLDLGCGTGVLMQCAEAAGQAIEGIELTPDRREATARLVKGHIYDQPLESLALPSASYAAMFMINVFSHLVQPSIVFAEIHRLLVPGGVLVMRTSEIGTGVRRWHKWGWELGDHLHFLGDRTAEQYGRRFSFTVLTREQVWEPTRLFSRDRFAPFGGSRARNVMKDIVLRVPGLLPVVRSAAEAVSSGNPIYDSVLVLRAE